MFRAPLFCLGLFLSFPAIAFEFGGASWAEGRMSFHVAIPGFAPSGETWQSAFSRAMDAWTQNTAFQFDIVNSFVGPCTGQQTENLGDGKGGVGFASTSCGSAFGENVLAITLNTISCSNQACTGSREIVESDIVFNSNLQWDIYSGPLQLPVQEFERVALHELGHVLGLDHEFTSDAIMQPFAGDLNALQQDDINGANFIYDGVSAMASVYGISILLPSMQEFDGPEDNSNFSGELETADAVVDDKFIDIYQVHFANDSQITISMRSTEVDASLILARIDSTQQLISTQFFVDDDSAGGTDAQITQQIPAGTYWIGVTTAVNQQTGSYDIDITSADAIGSNSITSFTSIYGAEVEVNPNPQIDATLDTNDSRFDDRYIDVYQFQVAEIVELRIDARSGDFDTKLLLVDVLPSQEFGSVYLENDDNGGGTNSTIQTLLAPGTYWMAVTSFSENSTGNYDISVTVVVP